MMKIIFPTLAILAMSRQLKWAHVTFILFLLSLTAVSLFPLASLYSPAPSLSSSFMSTILVILSLWLLPLTLIASYPILQSNKDPFTFLKISATLLMFLLMSFSVNSLLKFYIAFEATLIPTMFLIMRWGPQPERILASMYMLMYTLTASLPLLITLLALFHSSGSLSTILPTMTPNLTPKISTLMIIAFLVKLPMYSLHQWLPKAHVEAPVAGSMILAGVLLKLGAYGLFLIFSLNLNLGITKYVLSSLSLWGACLTAFICMRQTDMKALIAYASVSHMSLMLTAILNQSTLAWQGTAIMLIAHGLTSSGLFAAVNTIYESYKTRSLALIKAILAYSPLMALWWFLLITSNMATPPFINLPAEMLIISTIASTQMLPYIILLMSLIFFTSSYSLLLFTSSSHGPPYKTINSSLINSPRTHLLMTLHLLPLLIIILKMTSMAI